MVTDTMYLYDDYYLIDKIIILISYLSMEPNTIEQTHVTHLDKNKCSKCGFKSKSHKWCIAESLNQILQTIWFC